MKAIELELRKQDYMIGTPLFLRLSQRGAKFLAVMTALAALAACTTIEGTNAFKDGETFEREVLSRTAQGFGLIPSEKKASLTAQRPPLVLPKNGDLLPIPVKRTASAELPEDSDDVLLDTSRLTANDIRLLRGARVIDLEATGGEGRPLTPAELAEVAKRFRAQREAYERIRQAGNRPLFMPPERYFTKVGDQNLICLTESGDLVPLDSPLCPPELRSALQGE